MSVVPVLGCLFVCVRACACARLRVRVNFHRRARGLIRVPPLLLHTRNGAGGCAHIFIFHSCPAAVPSPETTILCLPSLAFSFATGINNNRRRRKIKLVEVLFTRCPAVFRVACALAFANPRAVRKNVAVYGNLKNSHLWEIPPYLLGTPTFFLFPAGADNFPSPVLMRSQS